MILQFVLFECFFYCVFATFATKTIKNAQNATKKCISKSYQPYHILSNQTISKIINLHQKNDIYIIYESPTFDKAWRNGVWDQIIPYLI